MTEMLYKVDLTHEDAEAFRLFREYQDQFQIMVESGVFNTKRGSIILHFDVEGKLAKIDRNNTLFAIKLSTEK